MPDVGSAWARIEAWLRGNAPASWESLRAGAPLELIREAARVLAVRLPDEVVASLLQHDGVAMNRDRFCFPTTYALLGTTDMIQSSAALRQMAGAQPHGSPGDLAEAALVPIAESVTGSWLIVDCAAGPGRGRVGTFAPGDGVLFGYPSLTSFLDAVATALERDTPVDRRCAVVAGRAVRWQPAGGPPPETLEHARRLLARAREQAEAARRLAGERPRPTDVYRKPSPDRRSDP